MNIFSTNKLILGTSTISGDGQNGLVINNINLTGNLTGSFPSSSTTGQQLTGTFYPLNSNPLVYKRASDFDLPNTVAESLYWNHKHLYDYQYAQSFNEDWSTSGAAWTKNSDLTISGGNVYCTWTGTSNPAMVRPFVVRTGENARLIAYINIPNNTGARPSGQNYFNYIGFSSDAPGSAPQSSNSMGIGVTYGLVKSGYTAVAEFTGPGSVNDTGNLIPGKTYILQATIDQNFVTFNLMDTGNTYQYHTKAVIGRLGATINNVYIYNGDPNAFSGVSFGRIGARVSSETIYPRTGLEGVQDFIINTTDDYGQNIRVEVPANYDSQVPYPLLVYCHGTDGLAEQVIYQYQYEPSWLQCFKNNGYIVAASANHGTADAGSNNSIQDTINLINWIRKRYSISSVILLGVSAGGLVALNAIASHKFKCDGFMGLFPVCNLYEYTYPTGSEFAGGSFVSGAYGITGGFSDYFIKTSGHDPVNSMSPERLFGVPMRIYDSYQDVTVSRVKNIDLLAPLISGQQSEFTIITTTGAHGDVSNYNTGDALSFFQRCCYMPYPSGSGQYYQSQPYLSPNGYVFHSETGNLTGTFYTLTNPSGFITSSQTGSFLTTGQTGSFSTISGGTWTNLTWGSTTTWNVLTNVVEDKKILIMTGNTTLAISGLYNGWAGLLETIQSGTAASGYVLTLPSGTKVMNGGSGQVYLTSGSGVYDMIGFQYDGTRLFANIGNNFN